MRPSPLLLAATQALGGAAEDVGDPATSLFVRALEAAHALGGEPTLVGVLAGDGQSTATFAVRAGTTWWRLEISHDATPKLTACPTNEYALLEHRFSEQQAERRPGLVAADLLLVLANARGCNEVTQRDLVVQLGQSG